ncbi:hypothetical protein XFLM_07375 [Xylella fastidiosa subsp. fastidiosa GB514]|nr:hypothetical protein XFLM_07375 [Xylella fastidiosa subsp. fastidiosa GB514]
MVLRHGNGDRSLSLKCFGFDGVVCMLGGVIITLDVAFDVLSVSLVVSVAVPSYVDVIFLSFWRMLKMFWFLL